MEPSLACTVTSESSILSSFEFWRVKAWPVSTSLNWPRVVCTSAFRSGGAVRAHLPERGGRLSSGADGRRSPPPRADGKDLEAGRRRARRRAGGPGRRRRRGRRGRRRVEGRGGRRGRRRRRGGGRDVGD